MKPGEGWSAILVIRAWAEGDAPEDFRARVIGTADVSKSESSEAVSSEAVYKRPSDVVEAVQAWLEALTASRGQPPRIG